MARARTSEEILNQMVYAVACVVRHYGPGYSDEGLQELRESLNNLGKNWCDGEWTSSVLEGGIDGNPDFCPSVIPNKYTGLDFDEIVERSIK